MTLALAFRPELVRTCQHATANTVTIIRRVSKKNSNDVRSFRSEHGAKGVTGRVVCSQINRIVKESGTPKKTTPMLSMYERNRLLSFYWAYICAHMCLRVCACVCLCESLLCWLHKRDKTPKIPLHIRTGRTRSLALYTKMCIPFFVLRRTERCRS